MSHLGHKATTLHESSGRRAKFYDHGLESVAKLEGHEFVVSPGQL